MDALILVRTGQNEEDTGDNPGLWIDLVNEIQTTLANGFISGGVLDRFPRLKVVCSEFEISWIPGFMARLDQIEDIAPRLNLPKLQRRASRSRVGRKPEHWLVIFLGQLAHTRVAGYDHSD